MRYLTGEELYLFRSQGGKERAEEVLSVDKIRHVWALLRKSVP
jgi:hypothetical protein